MRILHIFSNPQLTHGASVFEYRIAERLHGDGIFFDYLVTRAVSDEDMARYARLDSRVFCLPIDEKHGLFIRELRINRQYYRFFRAHPYDIVYVDTENALRAMHLLMVRLAGVRVRVLHSHNTGLQTVSRAARLIARAMRPLFRLSATDYFACSDAAAEWLFPRSIVRKKKYEVLKNGVDLERFSFKPEARDRLRRELKIENRFVMGSVGRLMPQKNPLFLLDVLKELLNIRPDAMLLLVGEGPLREDMLARVKELNLEENVLFTGAVENVAEYLCAMDAFVLASIFEGLGIVNIEAQATGLPCLMSEGVPLSASVTDRAARLPLSAGARAWAEKICAMAPAAERGGTQDAIRAAGYSIETTAKRLLDFYREKGGQAEC